MARRYYSSTAARTTLSSGINSTATSITVASTSGFPGSYPYTLIIDQDQATEEVVTVTAGSGTTLTVTRGVDGTAGVAHSSGATVNHGVSARDFDEPNSHVNDTTTDVHSQYVLKALVQGSKGAVPVGTGSAVAALSPGSNGEILYADSSATNGLRWQPAYNAGRNRIINGGFDAWQRSTSTVIGSNATAYVADRWFSFTPSGGSITCSRQAFTAGNPITGYEPTFFMRHAVGTATTGKASTEQRIEDVRTFAGQTVTISFWAKADSARSLEFGLEQIFGSGGSPSASVTVGSTTISLTSSWVRYTLTLGVSSISGKTLGTTNSGYLKLFFAWTPESSYTLDIWGVQLEAGNVATRFEEEPFEATLRKCQRYYYVHVDTADKSVCNASAYSSSIAAGVVHFPTTMRTGPSLVATSGSSYYSFTRNSAQDFCNSLIINRAQPNAAVVINETEISSTAGHAGFFETINAAASVAFSAEL